MNKIFFLTVLLIVPDALWCPGEPEVVELFRSKDHFEVVDPRQNQPVDQGNFSGGEALLHDESVDHEDLFKDADVSALLENPDTVSGSLVLPAHEAQQVTLIQDKPLSIVTTSLDALAGSLETQQSVNDLTVADKEQFFSDITLALSRGEFLIKSSQEVSKGLDNNPNGTYADYAKIFRDVEQHVRKVIELENRIIDFDYPLENEQTQVDLYQNRLDAQIKAGRDLLAQLQEPLKRKALTDLPMINKKLEDLRTAFSKIDKSTWWGGKSLADVATQLNELHLILDNALTITPDDAHQKALKDMKDIVQIFDKKLVDMQLNALRAQDLITRSFNAIAIVQSQPSLGYTASKNGKAEMSDVRQVLKALDAILLDDPLYRDRYLQQHDALAFQRLNDALDAAGIERRPDESEEVFLKRPEVEALRKELFPKVPDAGVWKDSLDFNVALFNKYYLDEIYYHKKGVSDSLKNSVGGSSNLKRLVKDSNKRFTSGKRSTKLQFFNVEDSQVQGKSSVVSTPE